MTHLPGGVFHSSLLSSHDSSLHPWICVWGFPCLRLVWRETSRPDLGPNIATEPVNPEQAANEQQQNEEVHSSLRKSKWQGRVQTWLVRDNSWSAKESAYALNPIYFQETRLKLKWTIIYLCDCLSCICCTGFFTLGLPLGLTWMQKTVLKKKKLSYKMSNLLHVQRKNRDEHLTPLGMPLQSFKVDCCTEMFKNSKVWPTNQLTDGRTDMGRC